MTLRVAGSAWGVGLGEKAGVGGVAFVVEGDADAVDVFREFFAAGGLEEDVEGRDAEELCLVGGGGEGEGFGGGDGDAEAGEGAGAEGEVPVGELMRFELVVLAEGLDGGGEFDVMAAGLWEFARLKRFCFLEVHRSRVSGLQVDQRDRVLAGRSLKGQGKKRQAG